MATTLLERLEDGFAAAPNLGVAECLLRIAGGVALVALAADGTIGAWGYLCGVALAVSGATWVCPVYRLLGIGVARRSTRRSRPLATHAQAPNATRILR
jgi:hypothetical protein